MQIKDCYWRVLCENDNNGQPSKVNFKSCEKKLLNKNENKTLVEKHCNFCGCDIDLSLNDQFICEIEYKLKDLTSFNKNCFTVYENFQIIFIDNLIFIKNSEKNEIIQEVPQIESKKNIELIKTCKLISHSSIEVGFI